MKTDHSSAEAIVSESVVISIITKADFIVSYSMSRLTTLKSLTDFRSNRINAAMLATILNKKWTTIIKLAIRNINVLLDIMLLNVSLNILNLTLSKRYKINTAFSTVGAFITNTTVDNA
jgi:hypothetical protein